MESEDLSYPLIPVEFYRQTNVVDLAQSLLGKVLVTNFEGEITRGLIVETEAYNGVIDKASHAYGGRRTKRNEAMYQAGGIAYVYLCYVLHYLFNVVTSIENDPKAVLIRGILPMNQHDLVQLRRKQNKIHHNIGIGPGKASQCMGINTSHNSKKLIGNEIWLEEHGLIPPPHEIIIGPRIGVGYAGNDALLPYRFRWLKSFFS